MRLATEQQLFSQEELYFMNLIKLLDKKMTKLSL
jgi:hypothetical protein